MGLEFWDDLGQVPSREGTEFWVNGSRFVWARNEFGTLYKKSVNLLGQVGSHRSPTYTLQEYIAQCRAMAEAHAAALPPEVKAMIGMEVALAGMFDMAPAPQDPAMVAGYFAGAVFL